MFKPKVKIIAHCLVRNEERFVWYALNSVLPYVDKIMVWDTGSTDETVAQVQSITSSKIDFFEYGQVDANSHTTARQRMLNNTGPEYTWLMLLDGDEIWPLGAIHAAVAYARSHPQMESLVVRTRNLVGDIYHALPESAGQYHLAGQVGHLNLRFMNLKKIPGLHVSRPHGQQGYVDAQEILIQNRPSAKIKLLDVAYVHATHLRRSASRSADMQVVKRAAKYKFELGQIIPSQQLPQVFFAKRPASVPDVTLPAPLWFWAIATVATPLRRLRRLFASGHGY